MRRFFQKITIFLLVFLFAKGAYAAEAQSGFNVYRLPSGQTLIVKEMHSSPIVTIDTWIQTGSIYENDKNNGVAHFLEHLFFKGTKKHPKGEFDRVLEAKGAVLNAATSKDFTHYYITIPSKEFQKAIEMHADMLLNPEIPASELEKERKVVIEEIIRQKDRPQTLLYDNFNALLYREHPYKRDVIGTKEIISSISRDEILEFYSKYYVPENMTTLIIGDISSETAYKAVEKEFAKIATKKLEKPVFKKEPKISSEQIKTATSKVENAYMMIGFRTIGAEDKRELYALDVLAAILGAGKSSRLYQDIKEQKQLAISISASSVTYKDDGFFVVNANFSPENLELLQKEIFNEIKSLQTKKVEAKELEKIKSMMETDALYSRESTSDIADEVGYTSLLFGGTKYYENYVDNIKKVTANDVKRAAKKYLNKENSVTSILLPQDYKKSEAEQSHKKDFKANFKAKILDRKGDITAYNLENSAKLLIEKNNQNDIVAIQIYSKGGSFLEEKPGTASILASVMTKGTKNYSQKALADAMDENGIIIQPQSGSDVFTVTVKTTKNRLDTVLELLKEVMTSATLDAEKIENAKVEKVKAIKSSRDNPFSVTFEEFKAAILKGHVYGNTGKIYEKTIPQIQKEDVQNYYETVFAPENTVISINGNVDESQMINYFSSLFEAKIPEKPAQKSHVIKPVLKNETIRTKKDIEGAWIVIGWQVPGLKDKKEYATLEVIDSLLGGGMSSRLFIALREDKPLAYQVGSNYLANLDGGIFAIHTGTNGATLDVAKNVLFKQVDTLKKEFVSETELKEVKDKLLGNYILSQETNADKASTLGWYEVTGRGFAFSDEYQKLIESVTAKDIIQAANKYFNKPYVMSITAK